MDEKPNIRTIAQLLDEDNRKELAEMILTPDVKILVIILQEGKLKWASSEPYWTTIVGMMDLAMLNMRSEYQAYQESSE